jgi:hypothetical protein
MTREGIVSVSVEPTHRFGEDMARMEIVGSNAALAQLAAELSPTLAAAAPADQVDVRPADSCVTELELERTPPGSIVHTNPAGLTAGLAPTQYRKTHFAGVAGGSESCWLAETRHGLVSTTSRVLARIGVAWGPLESRQPGGST